MASNPFDDFAQDFGASLPGQQKQVPPSASSGVGAGTAGGAASFPTNSFGVQQQQMPPSAVMNQPQQFGQIPVSQQYPGQQLPSSAPAAVATNGTAVPPVKQQPPPSQQPVIGTNTSAAGMYYQQAPGLQAHGQLPPQTASSALVPTAVDSGTPSPYASMLGPPPVGQQLNATPSLGVTNGGGAPSSASSIGVNPFQAGPPTVASTAPVIDQSNPFAVAPAHGAPLGQAPVAGGASTSPPFQESLPGVSGVGPPAAPAPYSTPAVPPAGPGQFDPISMPTPPPAPSNDPFGASAPPPSLGASVGALVPASQPSDDPFGVFATPSPAVAPADLTGSVDPVSASAPPPSSDPWADMGFGPPIPDSGNVTAVGSAASAATQGETRQGTDGAKTSTRTPGELPPGGEWYDARIFTPTLGVMFFKPQELTDSLFLQTDKALVDALDDRPVVAFIVEGSSARSAGVELGHVLLKVNGIDVKNPKEASRLIKEGPRPLPLLFYVPDTTVVVAEGEHMVKYDTRETGAPNSAKDWKPKYVVIGGIIAQPWMMNMYRSKVS